MNGKQAMNSNDLSIILSANVSLIVVETYDELRALELMADQFRKARLSAMRWSVSDGLGPLGFGVELKDGDEYSDPEKLLKHIKEQPAGAYVLCDFHPFIDDPKVVRYIKDIALKYKCNDHKIVFVSHKLTLPDELTRYAASVSLSMPSDEEILAIVREEARAWASQNSNQRIKTDNQTLQKLVSNLRGMPHQDVRRLAHGAIADDGAISEEDLPELAKAKFDLMDMEGVLHFEYSTERLKSVAGLHNLKQWLEDRRHAIQAGESKLDPPKGVLLFGVQGGGKSLAAKSIAGIWGLPLLRLDMGALYNKYVGETEKNLREALKLADLMSPCVLWLDEIEKGMSTEGTDNATSKRLLGTLLTWMSERKSQVFMVATSNDISQLPPELMRKGRFDEIFFVDLPDEETRKAIFVIHLEKRDHASEGFDLNCLARATEGFTGAEIEQAIVSSAYAAVAQGVPVCTKQIVDSINKTQPLSVVMAESINRLRQWAKDRAVYAN